MVTISELSSNIYFIKSDIEVNEELILQLPEITKIIGCSNFDLKLGDIWILRLIGRPVRSV